MDKEELKKKLLENETAVLQDDGTELPYTGKYLNETGKGIYNCKVCGAKLFDSNHKLDSNTGPVTLQGWPSFQDSIPGAVEYVEDTSFGMYRTEAVCVNCKAHLGHLFDDDDTSTGKHLCINSCSIDLKKED